ncbi:YobA family protein [Cytobacillus firmus]|nr:YobA family protein [Cytobacillus firmus]
MKRAAAIFILIIVLLLLWLIGILSQQAQVKEGTATLEGTIVMKENIILLIGDKGFTMADAETQSVNEIIGNYKSVYKLNNAFLSGIKSGDKVKIWYTEILESFPAQINVLKIEKL